MQWFICAYTLLATIITLFEALARPADNPDLGSRVLPHPSLSNLTFLSSYSGQPTQLQDPTILAAHHASNPSGRASAKRQTLDFLRQSEIQQPIPIGGPRN